jgi:hypothetical protein
VKTPCRNGNEHHLNPLARDRDMSLREGSGGRIYIARRPRILEFSHSLLEFCTEDPLWVEKWLFGGPHMV